MTQEQRDRFSREAESFFRSVALFRLRLDEYSEWNWILTFRDLNHIYAYLYEMDRMLREVWWEQEEKRGWW